MLKLRLATAKLGVQYADIQPGQTQRIRGSALQKIRDRILRRDNGLCQCDTCKAQGRDLPAHEVEHRIPLWKGGVEHDDNRYAINRDCHKVKTSQEAKERARGW